MGLMTSCKPTKNAFYFNTLTKDTTIAGLVNKDMESKIVKGDNLLINVSSLSKEEDLVFNTGITEAGSNTGTTGFTVDKEGFVTIHKVGKLKAEGLTRREFAALIVKELRPYLKDPIATVQYLNRKVTIMGAVAKPQVINMPEEQLSLIDVLVLSGDIEQNAKRNDVVVIRENGATKSVKHINLEDHSIFTSPWYYVQPNDIVVVHPDFEKAERAEKRARFQTTFGIILSAISLSIIIIDRIFR